MEPISALATWLRGLLTGWFSAGGVPLILLDALAWATGVTALLVAGVLLAGGMIYLEREVAAFVRRRAGREPAGSGGPRQVLAELRGLLRRPEPHGRGSDRLSAVLAPIAVFLTAALAALVIPWERQVTVARHVDHSVGLGYVLACSALGGVAALLAGRGSRSQGALSATMQIISYEAPLLLALAAVALASGSLSLGTVVERQIGLGLLSWNVWKPWLWIPLGLFVIAAAARIGPAPEDTPPAGFAGGGGGARLGLPQMAEKAQLLLVGLLFAVLFLGGWTSPFGYPDPLRLPPVVWLMGKALILVLLMMWVRATRARLRTDELLPLAWKLMIPAGFLGLLVVSIAALYV